MRPLDVRHLGRERVICCWQVGGVLIDPGPESCVENLLAELDGWRPQALLLTHIHFDHAGGAGALARLWPEIPVYVHEIGAPHMADPERLVASARRLYGEAFDMLWGEVVPIPADRLRPLQGGETVAGFEAAWTPGHAKHHVCFHHQESGWAFVGDMAGIRIPPVESYTFPPTPPPDIDVEAWKRSLETIAAWEPAGLGLTHFGPVADAPAQLARVEAKLDEHAALARELDREGFCARIEEQIRAATGDDATLAAYLQAAPPDQLWQGLERYWRKRDEASAGG